MFSAELRKTILKFIWSHKRSWKANINVINRKQRERRTKKVKTQEQWNGKHTISRGKPINITLRRFPCFLLLLPAKISQCSLPCSALLLGSASSRVHCHLGHRCLLLHLQSCCWGALALFFSLSAFLASTGFPFQCKKKYSGVLYQNKP